jgi:hypothetical protein
VIIEGSVAVANEIISRLRDVNVRLELHVDSTIFGKDSALKGIDFVANDFVAIKRAFDTATDYLGRRAFYHNGRYSSGSIPRELIRNAPALLDMSFAASHGFGYREIRDMPFVPTLRTFGGQRMSASFNSRFGFADEQEGYFETTSLHAELSEDNCNIHIDKFGFTMRAPSGVFFTPDFLQHAVDELGFKTYLAPLLGRVVGRLFHVSSRQTGNWMARNVTLDLPNYRNSYRPVVGFSVTPTRDIEISARFSARCGYCRDVDEDSRFAVPGGASFGVGITIRR